MLKKAFFIKKKEGQYLNFALQNKKTFELSDDA